MNLRSFLNKLGGRQTPEDVGRTDLETDTTSGTGAGLPGLANAEAIETVEADLAEEQPPA